MSISINSTRRTNTSLTAESWKIWRGLQSKLRTTCEFLFAVSFTIYGMVWKRTHNVHHIITNAPKQDPDNQHLPFLAVNHDFSGISSPRTMSACCRMTRRLNYLFNIKSYLYYPILMFGRFNLLRAILDPSRARPPRHHVTVSNMRYDHV